MSGAKYIELNTTACKKAPVPSKPGQWIYYYFHKYPGLALAVGSKGVRTFYIYKKFGKTTYRKKLASLNEITEDSKLDDRKLIAKLEAERNLLNDGLDPRVVRAELAATQMTYSELFTAYLQAAEDDGKKSTRKMKYAHDRYFLEFNNRVVSDISKRELQIWVKKLQEGSFKDKSYKKENGKKNKLPKISRHMDGKSTARKNFSQLRAVLNWGQKEGLIKLKDDPTYGVRLPKVRERERFIQPDELQQFQRALEAETDETIKDCIAMLLTTGARKSNIMAMRWQDINFDFQTWRIPDTKSGDSVTVALTAPAIEILRRRRDHIMDKTWVFPGHKHGQHIAELKKHWARLLERAKLTDLHIHDLRRTCGSYMAVSGASLQIIGKALGHRTTRATEIYSRLHLGPVRAALQQAQELMAQAASQSKTAEVLPLAQNGR